MRRYSWLKGWQAELLASVEPRRAQHTEVYDNSRDFGVLRKGDTPENGRGVWVTVDGDRVLLSLEERSTSRGSRVVRAESVPRGDTPEMFAEMVGTLAPGLGPEELSAQEVFKQLLRDYVRPALRVAGYKLSGNKFIMHRRGFEVTLKFRKSRFSTRDAVEYAVDANVTDPETVAMFEQANREATAAGKALQWPPVGQWHSSLKRLAGHKGYWTRLRADEDLEAHAHWLLGEMGRHLYPAIEHELAQARVPPTPVSSRERGPTRQELDEQYLRVVLKRAGEMGIQVPPLD